MFPNLPYVGFTWQITQHTGIVSADTIVGLLRGCAHLDGQPIDIAAIDARLSKLGRFSSETGRSLWRDYQQVLSEFGFIVSSASNNGMLMLTPVAKELLVGRMSFVEAMTLQLLRYQYANGFKRTIPKGISLNDGGDISPYPTLTDLQEACDVRLRPFVFAWQVLDCLAKKMEKQVSLSVDEMARFLLRCSSHSDVEACSEAIIAHRNGKEEIPDPDDNVRRNAADWMKLLSMTSVFSLETEGRKAAISLSEQANVHAEALRWFVDSFNTENSFWKSDHTEDWFTFYGKIDYSLVSLFDNPKRNLGWLMPSFIGGIKMAKSQLRQVSKVIDAPLQRITYGAPGTGKSHGIEEVVGSHADAVRTTFHPDSDYATFVGCYKPTMKHEKKTYVLEGKEAEVKGEDGKPVFEDRIIYDFVPQAFTKAYVRAWKKMAAATETVAPEPQYLVIEEINRGNCAQIFGDLFQLLDRKNDGYSKYPIEADSDLAKHIAKELAELGADAQSKVPPEVLSGLKLILPPNLYIWATMNTSDQSLFPMDSAFKRRWEWEYIPIRDAGKNWKIVADGAEFNWWAFIETVNKHILDTLKNEDKQLGYFFARPDADNDTNIPASKFVNKVLFYLYNDVFKDYDLPKGFARPSGDKFAFGDFFLADGKPNEQAVKELLSGLLGNLT